MMYKKKRLRENHSSLKSSLSRNRQLKLLFISNTSVLGRLGVGQNIDGNV